MIVEMEEEKLRKTRKRVAKYKFSAMFYGTSPGS